MRYSSYTKQSVQDALASLASPSTLATLREHWLRTADLQQVKKAEGIDQGNQIVKMMGEENAVSIAFNNALSTLLSEEVIVCDKKSEDEDQALLILKAWRKQKRSLDDEWIS